MDGRRTDSSGRLLPDEGLLTNADLIYDTANFYYKFFQGLPPFDRDRLFFRFRFIREEFHEFEQAVQQHDSEEIVDALIDMMVVILGTLHEARVNIPKAWREVHNANMQKVKNENPSRFGSAGWDLVKPEGWVGPSHADNHGVLDEIVPRKSPR